MQASYSNKTNTLILKICRIKCKITFKKLLKGHKVNFHAVCVCVVVSGVEDTEWPVPSQIRARPQQGRDLPELLI